MTASNYVESSPLFVDGSELDQARNTLVSAKAGVDGWKKKMGPKIISIRVNKWHVRDDKMHRKKGLWVELWGTQLRPVLTRQV